MPPLTQGLAPQQAENERQAQMTRFGVATSQTPTQMAAPTFSLDLPEEVPSTALRGNATYNDVLAARSRAEQDQFNSQALGGQYDQLMGRIQTPVAATPFQNPEAYINNLLLNRPTDTQTQLDQTRTNQAGAMRDFAGDYNSAGKEAREELGVGNLQAELGNTRTRIADRTKRFREDLRNFAVNAEQRGVSREFVDGARQKLQADAAAELADLAIIESAQTGNLQMAQQEVDRVLAEKVQAFQFENQAIEAEIKRLEAMDTREADTRKEQLQIALQERTRNIETSLANERESRGYLIEAAQNGADQGTLDAIRKATTPGEAALLAGPWVGRLDRQLKNAQINSANRANQPSEKLRSTSIIDQDGVKLLIDDQTGEIIKNFGTDNATATEMQTTIDASFVANVDTLKTHQGLSKAVGATGLARWTPLKNDVMDGDLSDFIGSVDQLTKDLTLDKLATAKDRGVTFGALSGPELSLVAEAATKINQWRRTEGEGENVRTTHYETSEKNFLKELDTISNFRKLDAVLKGTSPEAVGVQQMADGTYWTVNSDGKLVQIR